MSQVRESSNGTVTTSLTAVLLFLFMLASISFVFFSAFHNQTRWFCGRDCRVHPTTLNIAETSDKTTKDFPGENPGPTNISHIVFGIGGSVNTWKDRSHYSELWWQPDKTRGYVWLDGEPDPTTVNHENSPPYRVWTRPDPNIPAAVRIASIVVETFRLGLPEVRWFVMGDDDTVFFTENLVAVLGKYDHRRMYYIGGNSESVEQNLMHSYGMAFGGGGFAVSYPLAVELSKVFDGCLERYHYFYGSDQRVWACISELGVTLTRESGFHQIDIRGDAYGLLAAHPVAPLVSLHHLDYVKPLFPNQTQFESLQTLIQVNRVDPSRTIQQCFCYYKRWWHMRSVSISWGYTIQIYPSLLTANELQTPIQTFQTWRSWQDGPFTFNTRLIDPDPCVQPIIYYLDSVMDAGNETVTSYKRYVVEAPKKCSKIDYPRAVNTIIVSALKMNPQAWMQGSRRECCDVSNLRDGRMDITIRSCEEGDSITS